MIKREYFHPDITASISSGELKKMDRESQIKVMRDWFFSNFEDPAEHTPYESREGGYIYIWGGPYDAREELETEFRDLVSQDIIDEFVEELESHGLEWAGKPSSDGYDDYYYTVISANTEFHETLTGNLNSLNKLLEVELSPDLEVMLYKMIFVNTITTLETFLSDCFINTIMHNRDLLKKFVSINPDFANRKFTLSEIFDRIDSIEKEVRNYLLGLIWHNLAKAEKIYKGTLDIDFPGNIQGIYKAISKRHDIVHRNGKTKEGEALRVTKEELEQLMNSIRSFADNLNSSLSIKVNGVPYTYSLGGNSDRCGNTYDN